MNEEAELFLKENTKIKVEDIQPQKVLDIQKEEVIQNKAFSKETYEEAVQPQIIRGGILDKTNNKEKTQIELAKEAGNTWEFKGKDFELYLVNSKAGVGVGYKHPESGKLIGVIGAEFAWEKSEAFLEYLDIGWQDVTDSDGKTKPKVKNATVRDCKLFRRILQTGTLQEINEIGERGAIETLTHQEVLDITEQEDQSELISEWLGSFHISRFLDEGEGKLRDILKAKTLKFKVEVGEKDNPRHVFVMEFNKPSADARRDYEDNNAGRENENKDGKAVSTLKVDNEYRMKFAKKLFVNVQGVSLVEIGKPFNGTEQDVKAFRLHLLPTLWVEFAKAIMGAFQNAGKP